MRLGCIVRADRRGLAYQTGEFWRHMKPDVTVCVDISKLPRGERWHQDFDQYPGAIVTTWNPAAQIDFTDEAVDALLSCDVVYSAETFYDDRFMHAARGKVATVRHINCELYWPEQESHPIYPTSWRLPDRPEGPTVPVPVPDDRIAAGPAGDGMVLHVAGWQAANDRNGTALIRNAVRRSESKWRVTSQYGRPVINQSNVEVVGELEDRWDLYDGCRLLMMPRRYGGLCLPAQEAAARGMAVAMTETVPNVDWPVIPLPIWKAIPMSKRRRVAIDEMIYVDPNVIARVADETTGDVLAEWQERALAWARSLAWSKWAPTYRRMLERAAEETS